MRMGKHCFCVIKTCPLLFLLFIYMNSKFYISDSPWKRPEARLEKHGHGHGHGHGQAALIMVTSSNRADNVCAFL